MSISLMQEFDLTNCPSCGIAWAVPSWFLTSRRADGNSYYCPNGHSLAFQDTTVKQLERSLADAKRSLESERSQRYQAEAVAVKAERAKQRLQRRISAGVCPCCNRTFTDLQRHMGTKHKNYALSPAKDQKQITGAVQ